MKKILSDFVNLIFPKPEGEAWKWGEIVLVMGVIVFLISVVLTVSV